MSMTETLDKTSEVFEDNRVLTTTDNPFNPKTDYNNWRTWDERHGYFTEAYVARVADIPVDADLSDDALIEQYLHRAYQSILEHDTLQVYVLV